MTMTTRQKKWWSEIAVLALGAVTLLAATVACADNMPQAARGHMGASNTAALGMIGVGNGTGFAEQQPPNDCPLSQDASTQALECWDGSSGIDVGYDFAFIYEGLPTDGALRGFPAVRAFACADDFAGSDAEAKVASTGTAVFTVKLNGSTIGTATFTSSANGVWATTGGATSVADDDYFEVVNPTPQDATLSGVGLSFLCTR